MDYEQLRKNDVVAAIQPQQNILYSKIDFTDMITSTNPSDIVILNLNLNQMIDHTLPKIDRCCKLKGEEIQYDGIDNIQRIDCNISQKEFFEEYVYKRDVVMLKGCQNEWMAKNWTIENLFDRYQSLKSKPWDSYFQKTVKGSIHEQHLNTQSVKFAFNNGYLIKVFKKLQKDAKGWTEDKDEAMELMLDLFDDYSFPKPLPEDEFYDFHVDTNQAYLLLSTEGTGKTVALIVQIMIVLLIRSPSSMAIS